MVVVQPPPPGFFQFILFYVHCCFACVDVYVKAPDPLELELQTGVSCHVDAGN